MTARDIVMSAAGNSSGADKTYIEDVFSTYLYTGNGSTQRINNGIQLGDDITNETVLQLNGDSIVDISPIPKSITNNGGVTTSISTYKYGTASYYFSGTGGQNLSFSPAAWNTFGTGDFTVECWLYQTNNSSYRTVLCKGDGIDSGQMYYSLSGGYPQLFNAGLTSSVAIALNTWTHVALVRKSGVSKIYVNGIETASATDTNNYNNMSGSFNIGDRNSGSVYGQYPFNGYIDDFRVSLRAVYSSNFTPPAAALPLDTLSTGKGGMVWVKSRSDVSFNCLVDTKRGLYSLYSNTTGIQDQFTDLTGFNSNGYSIKNENGFFNSNGSTYASWTFRKAPKFFDVVTYTGNGGVKTFNHSLNATVGMIFIKATDDTTPWVVYQRATVNPNNYYLLLNTTDAAANSGVTWCTPTDTQVTLQNTSYCNTNGKTYVAYLFAHDTTTDGLIQCGSFTTDVSGSATVNLGWEPQYVMIKNTTSAESWYVTDTLRGFNVNTYSYLIPNSSSAEGSSTGVYLTNNGFSVSGLTGTYIYMAIRRGPMRTPTDATKVFAPTTASLEPSSTPLYSGGGFPADMVLHRPRKTLTSYGFYICDRLRGDFNRLSTSGTVAEQSLSNPRYWKFDNSTSVYIPSGGYFNNNGEGDIGYALGAFRRAPGFFDVVCYTGTGVARTINHNLGVAPNLMIVKRRDSSITGEWYVYNSAWSSPHLGYLTLESSAARMDGAVWNVTNPTSSVFSVGSGFVNTSAGTYVAYLFASCPGVSKVGTVTLAGASVNVDCGFTNGARFVLLKNTTASGNWWVYDTARGITAANDPVLQLNTTATEATGYDAVDPYAAGFTVNGSVFTNGTYIYLAIA